MASKNIGFFSLYLFFFIGCTQSASDIRFIPGTCIYNELMRYNCHPII
jgi:hypothetical protein